MPCCTRLVERRAAVVPGLLGARHDLADFDVHGAISFEHGCESGMRSLRDSGIDGRCSAERARVAGQHQRGIDDQTAALVVEGALQAGGERGVDLGRGERADRDGDEAVAEVAVGIEVAGRAALRRPGCRCRPRWRSGWRRRRRWRHRAASTVTESAMPSEKERPRAPEVAMPPMPEPASRRKRPFSAGTSPRENSPATPMSSAWPGAARGRRCRRRR